MSITVRDFSLYHQRRASPRRWLGPSIMSALAYVTLGTALFLLAPRELVHVADRAIDVTLVNKMTFVEKVAKEAPPPRPPATAAVEAPPQPPAAMAPIVRPDQNARHLEQPPPAKPLRAPRRMPVEPPKEADPSEDKGVAMVGPGDKGDAAGLEGGVTQGGVVGTQVGGVVELPNDAVPPRLMPGNVVPPYPPEARAARKTGVVLLKIVVFADGTVGDVRVVDGEEPFVTAAKEAVKSWRYEPARYKGQPIAVYREIRIPFELKG